MLVCTSMYWYLLVHTSIYSYILPGKSMYWLIQVHTATYQYMQVHTSTYVLIPAHTNSYKFILLCTGTYLHIPGFKKGANHIRTRDLYHTFRLLSHCTARVQTPNTGYESCEMVVYLNDTFRSCPCTWLLMTD